MLFLKNLVFICVGRQAGLSCAPADMWEVLSTTFVCVGILANMQS